MASEIVGSISEPMGIRKWRLSARPESLSKHRLRQGAFPDTGRSLALLVNINAVHESARRSAWSQSLAENGPSSTLSDVMCVLVDIALTTVGSFSVLN